MPFAVFRQHQRKLLAVFAIMAMIGFVLSDTLPRWLNSGGVSGADSVVADVYNQPVRRSDLALMGQKREHANRFMAYAGRDPNFFGGTTRAELLDAIILRHEADRLGIPETADFARQWVDQQTFGAMNATFFELILSKFDKKIGGEELLIDLAGQIRLLKASEQIAVPVFTPLDVFRNYRDQTERTSFKAVPFLVDSFVDKVGEPTDAEVRDLFEKYKAALPDPTSPDPGFKVPRKVKVEFLGIDANVVAKKAKDKIPEDELKAYYEGKKTEFPMDLGLPADLFLGEPKLTPTRYLPFSELRDGMADALAREKAEEEIQDTFASIRDDVVDKFADNYLDKLADRDDRKKSGEDPESIPLPKPEDLTPTATKYGMTHEITPLIDRRSAESAGRIAMAKSGSGRSNAGRTFAEVFFDPKTPLYSGFEFTSILGDRFLARKLEDAPAHVADLKEVRGQVVAAWKVAKARPLAQKAAEDYAFKVKAEGGTIKGLTVDGRPVLSIDSVTKMKAGMPVPSQFNGQFRFERGPATLSQYPQIPEAGQTLIDAMYSLKPGETVVEPDKPKTTYYAIALESRDPVPYMALMGPNGSLAGYMSETQSEVFRRSYTQGMARLREVANLKETVAVEEDEAREGDRS